MRRYFKDYVIVLASSIPVMVGLMLGELLTGGIFMPLMLAAIVAGSLALLQFGVLAEPGDSVEADWRPRDRPQPERDVWLVCGVLPTVAFTLPLFDMQWLALVPVFGVFLAAGLLSMRQPLAVLMLFGYRLCEVDGVEGGVLTRRDGPADEKVALHRLTPELLLDKSGWPFG